MPDARATCVAAGIPAAIATNASANKTMPCHDIGTALARKNQIRAAAADPQVPGPGRIRPIPKTGAINAAQSGAGRLGEVLVAAWISVIIFAAGRLGPARRLIQKFVFHIEHRRRDHVLVARPFAQIERPATLTAEREVLAAAGSRLLADRAFQFDLRWRLARHTSIVDGKAASVF
jgi:hypothetical protein